MAALVGKCWSVLDKLANAEIILVNNGSTDNSRTILTERGLPKGNLKIVDLDLNRGYGHGILTGLREAKGDVIGWTHADLQTDPLDFCKGIEMLTNNDGPFLVKGNRTGRPLSDQLFTLGMSVLETLLLKTTLRDINAQPTIFDKKSMWTWIDDAPSDFSLDLYAYYKMKELNCDVIRFPVVFAKRTHGHSHWNVDWKSKWKFIRRTLSFSWRLSRSLDKQSIWK